MRFVRRRRGWSVLAAVLLGASVAALPADLAGAAGTGSGGHGNRFAITVLSGRPDQVSGGDALVEVTVPRSVRMADATVTLDGTDVTAAFTRDDAARTLTGLVEGLDEGDNTLRADDGGGGNRARAELTLTNHPTRGPI
ncbi:MAG TPA: DUF6351 family protein, partial [Acidimicrobiales bacterium]|nr:DUF6351 family protein [Acidimicrobiales bacterium]